MDKVQFTAVFNRKKSLRPDGTALIQIEAYLNGKKKYFTTKIFITPNQWDKKRREITEKHPNRISLNKQITAQINELEAIEMKRRQSGQPFTLQYLRDFKNANYTNNFIEFCRHEVESGKLRGTSKTQHRATFRHFEKFRPGVEFEQINFELLSDFDKYLRDLGLHPNTITKHFSFLRRYVNLAIDKEIIEQNKYPFRKFKIKKVSTKRDYLTPEELDKLEALTIPDSQPIEQLAKDKFMFAVYTGLRYGDLSELRADSLTMENGKEYLTLNMIKTGDTIKVPIAMLFDGRGLDIFYKYAKAGQPTIFPFQRNDEANRQLRKVIELAGIGKHVTYHMARHSYATYLLYKGVSITTVQKLLGHRRLETTMIYSKVMDMTVERELQKVSFS